MDLLSQVLLCLVFVLSLALYSRLGNQPHPSVVGPDTGESSTGKSKSKKKAKKGSGQAATVSKSVDDKHSRDASTPSVPLPMPSLEAVTNLQPKERIEYSSDTPPPRLRQNSFLSSKINSTTVQGLDNEAGERFKSAPFEDQLEKPRRRLAEDTWQSVGKGAARASKHTTSSLTSYSSIASSNPFAVLPGDDVKPEVPQVRRLSFPFMVNTDSSKGKPAATSQKESSSLTKRQRQNAARAAVAKEAKEEEEKMRLARLEAHRREAQRERMREEERKKFAKGIRSMGVNVTSNGSLPESRGNRDATDYPICIYCSRPALAIYKHYTENLVLLLQCSSPTCGKFIDCYGDEEYRDSGSGEVATSWMDLILVKPRAYRHFLYNTQFLLPKRPHHQEKHAPTGYILGKSLNIRRAKRAWFTVTKRFVALSLVDAYLRWFYLCAYSEGSFTVRATRPLEYLPRYSLPKLLLQLLDTTTWKARAAAYNITHIMGVSYFMVWISTLVETLVLYSTVTLLSALYMMLVRRHRRRQRDSDVGPQQKHNSGEVLSDGHDDDKAALEDASAFCISPLPQERDDELDNNARGPRAEALDGIDMIDLYRVHLVPAALLLSSLSTLILLSIVLLWESKMPRRSSEPTPSPDPSAWSGEADSHLLPLWLAQSGHVWQAIDELGGLVGTTFSTDFAVRTILGGLSAGVSLAVIHPRSPVLTTSLLLLGWLAASLVRSYFTLLPPSDDGPGPHAIQAGFGQGFIWQNLRGTRSFYCAAPA